MLEIDLELVAFDGGNGAVAELAVEHALAEREVGAALVAETDRRRARFDDALRFRVVGDAGRALPAGTAARPGDVGERIGALRPLRPPQAFTAGHRRFFLDMRLGQLGKEAAWDRAGPLAVDAAVGRVEDRAPALRARDRDVG